MQEILDKLKADFEYITKKTYRGLVKVLGVGFASRLREFVYKIKFIEKQAFIATADKDYLYAHTGYLLEPISADTAKGLVVFSGVLGTSIPEGTELFKGDVRYKTTNAGIIKKINDTEIASDPISVIALEAGEKANVNAGAILKLQSTKEGLNTDVVVSLNGITGGRDDEAPEIYRARVMAYIRSPQAPFNRHSIEAVIKRSMPSLQFVFAQPYRTIVENVETVRDGYVLISALNKEYGFTPEEQKRVKEIVKAIKPANISDADDGFIIVSPVTIQNHEIKVHNVKPDIPLIRETIKKELLNLKHMNTVRELLSEALIKRVIYSVEGVQSFTLVQGGVSRLRYNTFVKVSDVEVTS